MGRRTYMKGTGSFLQMVTLKGGKMTCKIKVTKAKQSKSLRQILKECGIS